MDSVQAQVRIYALEFPEVAEFIDGCALLRVREDSAKRFIVE